MIQHASPSLCEALDISRELELCGRRIAALVAAAARRRGLAKGHTRGSLNSRARV
jgi:hypothetical protein